MSDAPTAPTRRARMTRRLAVVTAALMTLGTAAAADVLIQNYMSASFSAGAPPCLIKTAGEDVTSFPDGFAFDPSQTVAVDGVDLTQEVVTVTGVTGDRVLADEVYVIENNCTVDLDVSITGAASAGTWTDRRLEVWLGNDTAAGAFPALAPATGSGQWDQAPIVITAGGVTNTTTGTVTIAAGDSVPVGMVVLTGDAATGTGTATWQVQALTS